MQQTMKSDHRTTSDGCPAGGYASAKGLEITWHDGASVCSDVDHHPNGAFVETVISAAIDRLEYYQRTNFACRENAIAITKLEEAQHWLLHRTAERVTLKVRGPRVV